MAKVHFKGIGSKGIVVDRGGTGPGPVLSIGHAGISYVEPRVDYLRGQVSPTPDDGFLACGDGTDFPMKVTVDQLFKIVYQVRDAVYVSGKSWVIGYTWDSPSWEDTNEVRIAEENIPAPGSPLAQYTTGSELFDDAVASSFRGYAASKSADDDNYDEPPSERPMKNNPEEWFSDYYDVGSRWSTGEGPYGYTNIRVVEAVSEWAMWANRSDPTDQDSIGRYEIEPPQDYYLSYAPPAVTLCSPFRTGFSYSGTSYTPTTSQHSCYAPTQYYYSTRPNYPGGNLLNGAVSVSLEFSGKVVYVDLTGSGDPFDPGNELYLGMNFYVYLEGGMSSFDTYYFDTKQSNAGSPYYDDVDDPNVIFIDTGAVLKLELSDSAWSFRAEMCTLPLN